MPDQSVNTHIAMQDNSDIIPPQNGNNTGSRIHEHTQTICVVVFILPSLLAATTIPDALLTTRRIDVTASSRKITIIADQRYD